MRERCIERITAFLTSTIGITFERKKEIFTHKILELMREKKIGECEELYLHLVNKEAHYYALLEELLVSQSFFYRERDIEILMRFLQNRRHASILSLPCANGEEPYTIAIELMEGGIEDFNILAMDLNPKAIQRAKKGCYQARDLRNVPSAILSKYFHKYEEGYEIDERVKQKVEFVCANLFEQQKSPFVFDAIFCKNLFIYLDEVHRMEALDIFSRWLKDEGLLFLSFSDYFKAHPCFDRISKEYRIYKKVECNEKSRLYFEWGDG